MNRRSFLAAAGAAAFGAPPSPIIDTHTHFYDPGRPGGVPWPPASDQLLYRRVMPDEFSRLTAPLGVTATVVVEASAWLEDNQWILDLAKEHRVICGFVGHLEPGAAFRTHLERFRKNPLFRGIRLGGDSLRVESPGFVDDMRRLADAGLTLDAIGPGTMIELIASLAERVPKLNIVIDHLPYDAPVPQLAKLKQHSNVYAKISGTLRHDGIDEAWDVFGAGRLLFASNWPVSERMGSYADRLSIVRSYFAAKPADAGERCFWKNAKSAYRLNV